MTKPPAALRLSWAGPPCSRPRSALCIAIWRSNSKCRRLGLCQGRKQGCSPAAAKASLVHDHLINLHVSRCDRAPQGRSPLPAPHTAVIHAIRTSTLIHFSIGWCAVVKLSSDTLIGLGCQSNPYDGAEDANMRIIECHKHQRRRASGSKRSSSRGRSGRAAAGSIR